MLSSLRSKSNIAGREYEIGQNEKKLLLHSVIVGGVLKDRKVRILKLLCLPLDDWQNI